MIVQDSRAAHCTCGRVFRVEIPESCRQCGAMMCHACFISRGGFCGDTCARRFKCNAFSKILAKYGLPKSALPALFDAAAIGQGWVYEEVLLESV